MNAVVDLNSDLGEGAGHDDEILGLVTSANISCGLHAGSSATLLASIVAAHEKGVAVGAHPSFDDRENFGRTEMKLSAMEIRTLVTRQLDAFRDAAAEAGATVAHVKPHGALYNMAFYDVEVATAIAQAVVDVDPLLIVFAQWGSALAAAAVEFNLQVASEVFADRNYMADGSLVLRSRPDAIIKDPGAAAGRVMEILRHGVVRSVDGSDVEVRCETICVHGDTPDAVKFVAELRRLLEFHDVMIAPPQPMLG